MLGRCYFPLAVVAVASLLVALPELTTACPDSSWFYSTETDMCYRGLMTESLSFADAQRRCNQLRSNLFQFNRGNTKQNFDKLQESMFSYRNSTEFRVASWIGLTDRAALEQYVYLNNFPLNDIAPDTLISCPSSVPNCKPAYRCVYLDLDRRLSSNKQVFNGDCETRMPAICYAPVGGTDQFDKIPALGADSTGTASVAALLLGSFLSAALKSLVHC